MFKRSRQLAIATMRTEIMRTFLQENRLEGWFSWRPDELLLQTGSFPYWGLTFLLYLRDGQRILFAPEIEPEDDVPADVSRVSYPWGSLHHSDPFAVCGERLQQELAKRGIRRHLIGALRNSHRSSLPIMAAEQPPLPNEALKALTQGMAGSAQLDAAFLGLYLQKTPAELEGIWLANRIARVGLEAWRASLVPGTSEAEAAAAAEAAIHRSIGQPGIRSARAWAMVQSGANTAHAGKFNRSSGRRFETGDLVLIEMATCVNGYWSDLTRTAPIGQCCGEAADLLKAVSRAQHLAIDFAKPGVMAHEVDAIARESLRCAGFADYFNHATGHHVGFRYHDPGFAIAPGSSEILESGMVITIEPGAYVSKLGIGARIEDNIALTSTGAEIIGKETDPT